MNTKKSLFQLERHMRYRSSWTELFCYLLVHKMNLLLVSAYTYHLLFVTSG
jgi:hypothetical protein